MGRAAGTEQRGLQGDVTGPDEAEGWDGRCRTRGPPPCRRLSGSMALPTVTEWLQQLRTLHLASKHVRGKRELFFQEAN